MSNRLSELQRKHAAKVDELKALIAKSEEDEVSDEDKAAFESLKAQLTSLKESVELLKAARELAADDADEPEDEDAEEEDKGRKLFVPTRKSLAVRRSQAIVPAPGIRAARFAMANAIQKATGSYAAAYRYAEDQMGDLTVAKALNTTTQVEGGATIPQDFVAELIDLVRAQTVVRGSGARVLPMPMGNLTIPRLQSSSTAYWIDELSRIPESQPAFDDLYFTAKKLTALVPVTNDLLRRSPLSVEGIIRDDIVKQLALAEDKAFLTNTASATQPGGIFTLAAAGNKIVDTTAVPTLGTINSVLMSLELLLAGSNISTDKAMWIFHPAVRAFISSLTDGVGNYFFRDELQQGFLLGYPYKTTTQLPQNLNTGNDTYIFFVNMDDCIIADTLNLRVDSSDVASYGVNSATSAYTYDQTLFRAINEVDFGLRHAASAAVATVRSWKPTGWVSNAGVAVGIEAPNTTGTSAKSAKP
jgi:HK97 family phage major capsid protein